MATDPPEYLPYFYAYNELFSKLAEVYKDLGARIAERRYVYHRGAFYSDAAAAIFKLLELEFQPLMASNHTWDWWAEQMKMHADELGDDEAYAVILPTPWWDSWKDNPSLTLSADHMVSLMTGVYEQEEDDKDVSGLGAITPAECVKITHRYCRYYLWPKFGGVSPGRKPQPWLEAVTDELRQLYRSMGEPDKAGSAWATKPLPPGYVPPFSWGGQG